MTTTNQEMLTKIKRYLYEPEDSGSPELITSDMVLDLYNDAISELCLETDINYKQYVYTEATTDEPTTKTFIELTGSVETNLFKISELLIKDSATDYYRELWRTNMKDKKNISTSNSDTTYAVNIYDDSIFVNAGLQENSSIALSGRWKKAVQTTSGNFPLHPMAESAVIYFAVGYANYIKGNSSMGDKWLSRYVDRKDSVKEFFAKMVLSNAPHAIKATPRANNPMTNDSVIVFSGSITT